MRTLLIQNGDLVLGPGGFQTVSGAAKVKQDLAVAIKEPLGIDRFHERWGSTIHDFVGSVGGPFAHAEISSEITRIIRNYIATHGDQLRSDIIGGRRSRYSTSELIEDINGIDVRQEYDRVYLRVRLRTVAGDSVVLTSATGV